jgi:hypothetical protein
MSLLERLSMRITAATSTASSSVHRLRKPRSDGRRIPVRSHPGRRMIGAYGDTCRARAQTRQPQLGASRAARSPLTQLNSNSGSGNCDSRQRCMSCRVNSATGAGKTGIGAMSRNGCLGSGASPWIQTSAPPRDRSDTLNLFPSMQNSRS